MRIDLPVLCLPNPPPPSPLSPPFPPLPLFPHFPGKPPPHHPPTSEPDPQTPTPGIPTRTRTLCEKPKLWVIPRIVLPISVRSKWAGLGAQKGTPSAPQPMSSACQRFPIISYDIPSREKVPRRNSIVAIKEEGAELSPNARSANARFWGYPELRPGNNYPLVSV